jgi:hypothetical protein
LGLCGASLCQQRGVGRETSAATAAGDQPRELLAQARDRVQVNSNAFIKSEGAGIRIADDGLLGSNVEILDSDFHELHPDPRRGGRPKMAPVDIGHNAFVGNAARIVKASPSAPTRSSEPAAWSRPRSPTA